MLEEGVEEPDGLVGQFELEGVAALHLVIGEGQEHAPAAAHDVAVEPEAAQVLDADAGEDQQRDGKRPLDALGAAQRIPDGHGPGVLLLGEAEQALNDGGVVELRKAGAVAPAHRTAVWRRETVDQRLDGVDPRRIELQEMRCHVAHLDSHLVHVAGAAIRPLRQEGPKTLLEVVALAKNAEPGDLARLRAFRFSPAPRQAGGR